MIYDDYDVMFERAVRNKFSKHGDITNIYLDKEKMQGNITCWKDGNKKIIEYNVKVQFDIHEL